MIPVITLEEMLIWNDEASSFWKGYLDAKPELLDLACGIGGNADVQAFVRHIWGAELVWSQIIRGVTITDYDVWPRGPLNALFELHLSAVRNIRILLDDPFKNWDEPSVHYPWRRPEQPKPTPRKALAHVLLHSQRHWAQLSTLVRAAGFPSGFLGDLLPSSALE
ncbi:MAG TPA: hypothetical protein VME23_01765 [Terracidiphilus sp.]|nr:hypothetical protein [Terracidiphilus sp.]